MIKEYNFTYKDHYINFSYYMTGWVCASVRSDNDYFTKKYMDYTKAEMIEKIKQEINERIK